MLRLIVFLVGLKETEGPTVEGGAALSMGGGVMGPSSSSALLDGCDSSSSGEDSAKSLPRLDAENPLGDRMWGGPAFSLMLSRDGRRCVEDWSEGVQQMGSSSSSEESPNVDDPGRTYQKPTGLLDRSHEDLEPSLPLDESDDSEMDRSRPASAGC